MYTNSNNFIIYLGCTKNTVGQKPTRNNPNVYLSAYYNFTCGGHPVWVIQSWSSDFHQTHMHIPQQIHGDAQYFHSTMPQAILHNLQTFAQ